MNRQIIDGMKKEGRPFRNIMIFSYILGVLQPLSICWVSNEKYSNKDILLLALAWFGFGTISLYVWLYALKYRVEFDDNKVSLKTLFRKVEFNICDIEKYTCNRYKKSVFYQFNLLIKNKKVLVNTRYKEEFETILKDNGIEQIII